MVSEHYERNPLFKDYIFSRARFEDVYNNTNLYNIESQIYTRYQRDNEQIYTFLHG